MSLFFNRNRHIREEAVQEAQAVLEAEKLKAKAHFANEQAEKSITRLNKLIKNDKTLTILYASGGDRRK